MGFNCHKTYKEAVEHIVTELTKPCISNFGEKNFFSIFFVTSKADFVLAKFCLPICKDVVVMEPYMSFILALTAMNVFSVHHNISLF